MIGSVTSGVYESFVYAWRFLRLALNVFQNSCREALWLIFHRPFLYPLLSETPCCAAKLFLNFLCLADFALFLYPSHAFWCFVFSLFVSLSLRIICKIFKVAMACCSDSTPLHRIRRLYLKDIWLIIGLNWGLGEILETIQPVSCYFPTCGHWVW